MPASTTFEQALDTFRSNDAIEARHLSDEVLRVHIKAIHPRTRRAYGRPRILRERRNNGVRVGKQRRQALMHTPGIRAKGKKRFKLTTDRHRDLMIDALRMAWFKRHPGKHAGLIFHSDSKNRVIRFPRVV